MKRLLILALAVLPLALPVVAHAGPRGCDREGTNGDDTIESSSQSTCGRAGDDMIDVDAVGEFVVVRGGSGDDTLSGRARENGHHSGIVTFRGGLGQDTCTGATGDRFYSCETVVFG